MQHLSRRFSGGVFLYIVIAAVAVQSIYYLSFNTGFSFELFSQNATTALLLFQLIIFIPPFVAVALSRYPARQVLRIHAFPLPQLWFSIGIAICVYFAASMLDTLLEQLQGIVLYPDFAENSSYFNIRALTLWPYLFTSCLIPALFEGTVYYGAMLSGLHQMRPLKACLTIGLLYALVQLNFTSFIPNALLGFVLCYIALRANSIIPSMIAAFLYLLMEQFSVADRLYFSVLSPLGIGESAAAVIVAVVFILLGGLLLARMPDKRYQEGGPKRARAKLRETFPGLFSLDSLSGPLKDAPEAEEAAPATAGARAKLRAIFPGLFSLDSLSEPLEDALDAEEAMPASGEAMTETAEPVPPAAPERAEGPEEASGETAMQEAEAPLDPHNSSPATAGIPVAELDVRDNNPIIVGIFISATVTVILFGITIFMSFGYFGG